MTDKFTDKQRLDWLTEKGIGVSWTTKWQGKVERWVVEHVSGSDIFFPCKPTIRAAIDGAIRAQLAKKKEGK